VFVTEDPAELTAFVDLLQTTERHARSMVVPGCGDHTFEFDDARGHRLAAVERLGDASLRSYAVWDISPATLRPEARAALRAWLVARGVQLPD
jgi:hypothetical protein